MSGFTRTLKPRMLKQVPLTLTRSNGGQWVGGRWQPSVDTQVLIEASVQPVTRSTDLMMLPEGDRAKAAVEVWSASEIRMVKEGDGGWSPDRFTWLDNEYEVMKAMPWQMGHIDHYHAVCRRVETV